MGEYQQIWETVHRAEPHSGSSVSTSLLVRVKHDDQEAWQRMVRLFGPKVYQWCRRAGLQPADAAEVGQEVFQAVANGIGSFRRDRPGGTFRGWLWRITEYKLNDHWRSKARQPDALGGSSIREHFARVPDPLEALDTEDAPQDDADLLFAALESVRGEFEPKTWQAFWLVTVEDRTADEAAWELEMSRGAVYVAKSRVLRRLRSEFEGLIDLDAR